jgi:Tfp pilus assembly protein PilX
MKNISSNKQSGAVSLFVVIFFMLLATVVTVSFVRLMVNDQRQATDNDLSQSAYDSALAGVEDAKRALLQYQQDCNNAPGSCNDLARTISGADGNGAACNVALNGISGNGSTDEIPIQQSLSGNDAALDQAYTCVKIQLNTLDYERKLAANQSQLVPLIADRAFNHVLVEWFSSEDITTNGSVLDLEGVASNGQPLYTKANWPLNRPSLMRTQLIQFANNFTLGSFDTVSDSQTNAATMFLYPTSQQGIGERSFTAFDLRKTDVDDEPDAKDMLTTPAPISCLPNLGSGGYACKAELVLPQTVGAGSDADRTAFLRLTPFYNATNVRVTLWDGPVNLNLPTNARVKFNGVQPAIDSTGRANDLFRRVVSRVELFDTSFPYPEGIEVTGNFCKDFAVTDTRYIAGTASPACNP